MANSKKTEPSSFFLSFVGEYAQVISSFNFSRDNGSGEALPLIIEGFILDADDNFIYMSPDIDGGIKQAVKMNHVVYIQILEEEDELDKMFSSLTNVKKRDMN